MDNFLERVIIEPFDSLRERLLQFLPDILTSVLIFVTGIVLGVVLKFLFLRFFRAINLDRLFERSGLLEMMQKGGMKDRLSLILARVIGWVTIFGFLILSLRSLNVPAVERVLESFLFYLPRVFIAAIILFVGYVLGNFLSRAALIASVNAGFRMAGLIAKLVKLIILLLSMTMALEQLGIGRETIIIAFAIIFGGVVFALSLAFGLGGKDIAREYLEKRMKGDDNKDEINHL
jgi:hypothetical protein